MNKLQGKITAINTFENLSMVYVATANSTITSIVIDTPETNNLLQIGKSVNVVFKETEVIIGLGTNHQISMQNKFVGTIKSIDSNNLLSKLIIDSSVGTITSIITTNAVKQLSLQTGTEITAMVKTNEILILE